MERVLIVGAAGTTGHKIVNLIKASSHFEPIAMIRDEKQQEAFKAQGIETVLADLEQDVTHTVKHVDKVIFAAGSGGKKVKAVDQEGAKKMISASEQAHVKKFIMLSSMGADRPEQSEQLQDYLKAKHNADTFLKASKLNYTIIRPGTLNNDKGKGRIQWAKSLSKSGEITRDDVAQALVHALHDDIANTATFEILQGETPIEEALRAVE
ncbi:SDR family oxidoreductase [Mariniflexile ostreae]|uniref:SDR family oxidoreductase n=1 Tax=Mariniflexile ostreae TaxID=1520892 RepID=A0ABV5FE05_9FLAO